MFGIDIYLKTYEALNATRGLAFGLNHTEAVSGCTNSLWRVKMGIVQLWFKSEEERLRFINALKDTIVADKYEIIGEIATQ